jgi:hypothetical protein
MGGRGDGRPNSPSRRSAREVRIGRRSLKPSVWGAVIRGEPRFGLRAGAAFGRSEKIVMDRIHAANANREDVIVRLRQQVAEGAYEPPVDELVNRLVNVVMAQKAAGASRRTTR